MISPEQYKPLAIMHVRDLAVFAAPGDREAVSDLLDTLEAAPATDTIFTRVSSILLPYTSRVIAGEDVSPSSALRELITAARG